MYVDLIRPCMDSNMHLGHGIPGLTDTSRVWDLPRVKRILTCTSYLLGWIHSYWFCTLMIYFSQVHKILL
jgi:hypothetical protein